MKITKKTKGLNEKEYKPVLFIYDEESETRFLHDLQDFVKHHQYVVVHHTYTKEDKILNKHQLHFWQELESKCKIALSKDKFPKKVAFKNSEALHFYNFTYRRTNFIQGNYQAFLFEIDQKMVV